MCVQTLRCVSRLGIIPTALAGRPPQQADSDSGQDDDHHEHDPEPPVALLARDPGIGTVEADDQCGDEKDGGDDLDPPLHRATVLHIDGESYRMRGHREKLKGLREGVAGGGEIP